MKKVTVVLTLLLVPLFGMSQSIFDKFQNADNIAAISINKGMLSWVADMADEDQDQDTKDFISLAKSIDGIKIFVSEDTKASADMAATMKKHVKQSGLEQLMRVKDGDTNVKFYIKSGRNANKVKELVMFVTGIDNEETSMHPKFETVLLTMTGDIDLDKVGSLTNKMNLPKELKKAERGR
ncbi:DUF4252 domain-containing protein [uncultured Croceitalea sp.]|uniref:DUF4252 domain-containing protein n=1 Tax=uncultured Croceitalea sp. TaxID=1798908 RepID=UPI003305B34D